MSCRALVTGASGFLGRHLVSALTSRGVEIDILSRHPNPTTPPGVRAIAVASFTPEDIATAPLDLAGQTVFHCAAHGTVPSQRTIGQSFAVNVSAAHALLMRAISEGARGFVSCGSSAEYDSPAGTGALGETATLTCRDTYGASKAAFGLIGAAAAANREFPFAHLRLFQLYGPGEASHRLLPSLAAAAMGHSRISLTSGQQIRDFLFVSDAIEAVVATGQALAAGQRFPSPIFNVSTGAGLCVHDFVTSAAQAFGIDRSRLGFGDLAMRPDEVMHLVGNPDQIRLATGWQARTSLVDGLAITRENYSQANPQ